MTIKTVQVIGTGQGDDPFRPDLPEGTGYSVISDNGDGTMTVQVQVDQSDLIAALEARIAALENP
jgi:hypothetical protein